MGTSSRSALPFPPEIAFDILRRLSKRDAWSFAATSKTHYYLARGNFLFYTVDLREPSLPEMASTETGRGLRCDLKFIDEANIGHLIGELSFGVNKRLVDPNDALEENELEPEELEDGDDSPAQTTSRGMESEAASLIHQLFQRLPVLARAKIRIVGYFSLFKSIIEALGAHCPKLSTLDVYLNLHDHQPDLAGFSFSSAPTSVEKLAIRMLAIKRDNHFDRRRTGAADYANLSTILKHLVRPTIATLIELEFKIQNYYGDTGIDWPSFVPVGKPRGTLPLRVLKYDIEEPENYPDIPTIGTIATLFPDLESLDITPINDHEQQEPLNVDSPDDDQDEMLPFFAKLRNCKSLRLDLRLWADRDLPPPYREDSDSVLSERQAAPEEVLINHISVQHREWIMRELVGVMPLVERISILFCPLGSLDYWCNLGVSRDSETGEIVSTDFTVKPDKPLEVSQS